ncbi:hypothetical protein BDF20DRAFT_839916 [Mycotypha africana]|uniref:uncharacterized protein n=1 Tax=Mycotypha africana TaxID=64632 RepID=UPI0023009608|nr:uncharacterized protein BDF20DRAFT_839916 [Mycotypha africana]KAI8967708.1 hypothetical protein BDF20DRAFT_839916 [Mycotypha africana]
MGQEQSNAIPATNKVTTTAFTNGRQQQQSRQLQRPLMSTIVAITNKNPNYLSANTYLNEPQGGIIEVVKGLEDTGSEDELQQLRSIQAFEPFLKEHNIGFNFENLLRLRASSALPTTSLTEHADIIFDLLNEVQTYIRFNNRNINEEQNILLKRIAYANQLTSTCFLALCSGVAQARMVVEKLPEVRFFRDQAIKSEQQAIHIFQALSEIEQQLDQNYTISTHDNDEVSLEEWHGLKELRARLLQPIKQHESFSTSPTPQLLLERFITSSSDVATLGTTMAVSTPLEQASLTSLGPASERIDKSSDANSVEATLVAKRSTSSTSIALDRLRGLSSRSIQQQIQYASDEDS